MGRISAAAQPQKQDADTKPAQSRRHAKYHRHSQRQTERRSNRSELMTKSRGAAAWEW